MSTTSLVVRLLLGVMSAAVALGCGGPSLASVAAPAVRGSAAPSSPSSALATAHTAQPSQARAARPHTSNGAPRRARLTIPRLRIHGLLVVPYRGVTDDAPGTVIQDRGLAASPFGPRGGTGPGGIGNYQVTGHRLAANQIFLRVPELRRGARAVVQTRRWRYVYEIRRTRWTSFRSKRSLRAQRAPVPGRPGVKPTRAMLTLSTCATPEDHAAGNYWSDKHGNPEHRIDKIGVLVAARRRR